MELSRELKKSVGEAIGTLASAGAEVGWVKPDNLHLTLRFLGEIPPEQIEIVKADLKARLVNLGPIELSLRGLGRFPEGGRFVRVLWVGCVGELDKLRDLWERAQAAARAAGLPRDDHGFSPHITIGRVKSKQNQSSLLEKLAGHAQTEFGRQRIDRVVLMRSELSPGGAVYTPIERFDL